jgi:hypothetical protein
VGYWRFDEKNLITKMLQKYKKKTVLTEIFTVNKNGTRNVFLGLKCDQGTGVVRKFSNKHCMGERQWAFHHTGSCERDLAQ